RVEETYRDKDRWTKMSILNCANSGKFSTDRTISEYNRDIWKLKPQLAGLSRFSNGKNRSGS
ncbi:MAG: glycogen/starch/alpha-glucan phosphorylase, partial [Methylococcaceae bacterium]